MTLATAQTSLDQTPKPLDHTRQRVEPLVGVDEMIIFDLPDAPVSGGGTRLAPGITEAEMRSSRER